MTPNCPLSACSLVSGEGAGRTPPSARAHPPARTPSCSPDPARSTAQRGDRRPSVNGVTGRLQAAGRTPLHVAVRGRRPWGSKHLGSRGCLIQAGKLRHRVGQTLPSIPLMAPVGQRQGTAAQEPAVQGDGGEKGPSLALLTTPAPGGRGRWGGGGHRPRAGRSGANPFKPLTRRRDFLANG